MFGWTLAWLAGTAAVAGYSVTRHAPAFERVMLDDVQDAVAPLGDASITVSVTDHVATLSGRVDDIEQRDAMLAAANGGLGIRHVVDRLVVREPDPEPPAAAETLDAPAADVVAAVTPDAASSGNAVDEPTVVAAEASEAIPPEALFDVVAEGDDTDELPSEGLPPEDTAGPVAEDDAPGAPPSGEPMPEDMSGSVAESDAPGKPSPEEPSPEGATGSVAEIDEASAMSPVDASGLDATPALASPTLHLAVADRVLTIKGSLAKDDAATALVLTAMDNFELDYISNTLESGTGVASAEWLDPVAALLPALIGLVDPAIDVADGEVTLSGTAPDVPTRERIVEAALLHLGDHPLVEKIEVGADGGTSAPMAEAVVADETDASGPAADDSTAGDDAVESEVPDGGALDSDAAADDDAPDGDAVEGEVPDGDASEGDAVVDDVSDGDAPDGDAAENDAPDGDAPDDDAVEGEVTGGDALHSGAASDDAPDGDASDDDAVEGEVSDSDASDGDTTEDEAPDGDASDGDAAGNDASGDGTPADEGEAAFPVETALLESPDAEDRAAADAPDAATDASALRALRAAFAAREDERILFRSGSATLTAGSLRTVDRVAELLRTHPLVPVTIEGHTDGFGLRETNLDLSQRRANAVRDRLVSRGIPRERLTTYGYGESVPIADNATPDGRAANRRIEFIF